MEPYHRKKFETLNIRTETSKKCKVFSFYYMENRYFNIPIESANVRQEKGIYKHFLLSFQLPSSTSLLFIMANSITVKFESFEVAALETKEKHLRLLPLRTVGN